MAGNVLARALLLLFGLTRANNRELVRMLVNSLVYALVGIGIRRFDRVTAIRPASQSTEFCRRCRTKRCRRQVGYSPCLSTFREIR
ncbi:MAG: hypothetical protein KGK33_01490 [Hyphomicrobiales bacterium]|nr:hypothetical protein [Hyphomicrobiales bacterium]